MPPPNGSSGPTLREHVAARGDVGEVDDHIGAFGQAHEQPVAVVGREVDRRGEEAALVPDLPGLDARDPAEVEDEEARLAAVEEAEAIAALLDGEEGPGVAVDHDRVAEELRIPDRGERPFGDEVPHQPVEERARVGVEQRAVLVEGAILDRDRDLPVRLVRRELVVLPRRRAWKRRHEAGSRVEHSRIAGRSAADEVEAGRACVDVEPRHAERVVVVPDRRGAVLVRVLEGRVAGPPLDAVRPGGLAGEEVVPGALGGVARRDVSCSRQVPGFRVAVAVVRHADGAVHVRDDRHRACVRAGCLRERRAAVPIGCAAGWVRPVQGLVDGKQMREVVPAPVDEVVDPLHTNRPVPRRLDRERGGVVDEQRTAVLRRDRAVPPDRGLREACGENLLLDLPHRDLVVVEGLAARLSDRGRSGHDRRDQHRCGEFGHDRRVERVAGNLGQRGRCAQAGKPAEQVEAGTGASDPGDERPSGVPPHGLHQNAPLSPDLRIVPPLGTQSIRSQPHRWSGDSRIVLAPATRPIGAQG